MTRAILILLLIVTPGCGMLLPSTRNRGQSAQESSRAVATQEQTLSRVVKGTPKPDITVGGWGNKVEFVGRLPAEPEVRGIDVPYASPQAEPYSEQTEFHSSLATDHDSEASGSFLSKTTIPMGVNLMLLAAGILAVLFAVRMARNSSAAANVAFQTADAGLASMIRSLRDRAAVSTDPGRIADYQTQIAELESQRGRLAR